jgi:hypothetical protein
MRDPENINIFRIPERRECSIKNISDTIIDALAKTLEMAKQKFRSTRLSGFSGVKAYRLYVEVLKNHYNAVGRTFCNAINHWPTKFSVTNKYRLCSNAMF